MSNKKQQIPAIRFNGFTDAWEQRKLEDGTSKIGDGLHGTPEYTENGEVAFINGNNLVNGKIVINDQTKFVTSKQQSRTDAELNENTILMSINGTIGNLAWYRGEKLMLGKSAAYIEVKSFHKKFIYQLLQTHKIRNYFLNNLTGTTIKNLGLKTIRETPILIPKVDEQQKIGSFFERLDDAIALHQRQLDNYKELKKAMMQNIFNKKLRFKNGNGNEFPEWKKKKLNNFCSVTTGKLDANAMKENGVYKFFTCSHQDYLIDTYAFEGESLIIAGNGDVGHIKYYNGKFNAYQRTYILQNFENISAVYLKNNLENELPRRIQRETQQSAMVYIKLSTLTEAEIDVPIMEEQNIIGDFLSKFDSMIAKQEKIIDLFKEQKKVLMQKMFV